MGLGDRTGGNLKSDHIISRLAETTEASEGFQDIVSSILLPLDQIQAPPAPKMVHGRIPNLPRESTGESAHCALVTGFRLSEAWS